MTYKWLVTINLDLNHIIEVIGVKYLVNLSFLGGGDDNY